MLRYIAREKDEKVEVEILEGPCKGAKMVFNCAPRDFLEGQARRKLGMNVQDAFPFLSADEREFLISGLTPEKFAEVFKGDDSSDIPTWTN